MLLLTVGKDFINSILGTGFSGTPNLTFLAVVPRQIHL
jgi:hypothetical protein